LINSKLPLVFIAGFLYLIANTANAGERILDEIRFGGGISDIVFQGQASYYEYDRPSLNAELLFSPLNFDYRDRPGSLLTPRIHIGGTLGLENNGISSLYSGLTWRFPIVSSIFVEASLGAAIHNGKLTGTVIAPGLARRGMGSRILFRESIALGASLTENLNVIVELSHISHAGLAGGDNVGQTSAMIKFGWKLSDN